MNGSKETLFQLRLRREAQARSHSEGPRRSQTRLLSAAQQRIVRLDESDPSRGLQTRARLRMCGVLNRAALRAALDRIFVRHEVLRTRFESEDGQIVQRVEPPDSGFPLEEHVQTPNASSEAIRDNEAPAPFDLARGPLVRGHLLQTDECEHLLVISLHASVADVWSVGVMLRELVALYNAFCVQASDPLPQPVSDFSVFASLEREQMSGEKRGWREEYWARVLTDIPETLNLPVKAPRTVTVSSATGRVPVKLPAQLYAQLQALAYRREMPLFVPLLCGWAVLLGRWSGQEDVVIGTRMPNRASPEFERLIGPFENVIALRVRIRDDTTVGQLLKDVKAVVRRGQSHQDVSFEQVAEGLGLSRGCPPRLQALMNVNASQEVSRWRELNVTGLKISDVSLETLNSPFELSLSVDEGPDGIAGALEYTEDLFERETIQRLLAGWETLLGELVADVYQPVSRLPIMSEPERRRVVVELNETAAPYPRQLLIHQLFEEQAERTPDWVAAEHEGSRLTYSQLNRRANQLARYLLSQGVGTGQVVGICVERGLAMVVGLLAILKAGGAYLPLDPNYPPDRLQQMLEDAAPAVVLTETERVSVLPAGQAKVIALDQELGQIYGFIGENLQPAKLGLSSESLVYVIYTSGSTGRPKGTAMRHRAVVNLIEWHRGTLAGGQARRVLQFAALSFDVAFQEIFSTLCTGGTLVLLDEWIRRDTRALTDLLINSSIDTLFVPPLMLQSIAEHCKSADRVPASLRDAIVAGEQLRVTAEVRELFGRLEGSRLHNHYGPTETHVVTALTLQGDPRRWPKLPPIGRPIANTQIYVLDGKMQPAPIGVTGEIYIGGANVARGYLNRPELTAQRFVADPYSVDPEATLYKSGDLGRWRVDGALEYLGRNDDQVKIRGFRVELGEIEAQLARHERVKEAAVVVREDVPRDKRLVAYVTSRGDGPPRIEQLRKFLKGALPEYMVPSAFVLLRKLPLTPNGKLDRRVLPAPDLSAYVSRTYEAPLGKMEDVLAGLWRDLLRADRVGRNDNFFELGGNSLQIVKMMECLRELGLSVDVRRCFQSQSLADLASSLDRYTGRDTIPPNGIPAECRAIAPGMLPLIELTAEQIERVVQCVSGGAPNVQDVYPLAPMQEGILFHHLLDEQKADTYVLPALLQVPRGRVADLIASLQKVIDRHDVLRTAVLWEGLPQPVQVVYRKAALPVDESDLDPGRNVLEQIEERMRPERQRLDISKAPMMQLQVISGEHNGRQYALLQLHHMICDHESLETLFAEVKAHMDGHEEGLPIPEPYRDFIARAREARHEETEAYFCTQLGDIEEATAPFGLMDARECGGHMVRAQQQVPSPLASRIRAQARQCGVTPAALFHAAWALVISAITSRDDVVFGTVLLGRLRDNVGARRMLGTFMNTLPLRLRLEGLSVADLVKLAQRALAELVTYEQASLAHAQRCSGISGSGPLFTTLLNYRHSTPHCGARSSDAPQHEEESLRVLEIHEWTNYPFTVSIDDLGEEFAFTVKAHQRVGADRILGYLETAVSSMVETLEENPQRSVASVGVIPEAEWRDLVVSFNPAKSYGHDNRLVHELFEEQVERTPDAIAVALGNRSLTFSELNLKSNQIAWYLRENGVVPDSTVGICMERSLELITGVLGILKAGGAYVPLDPDYPVERLAAILADSNPAFVLCHGAQGAKLPAGHGKWIAIDGDSHEILKRPAINLNARDIKLKVDHLAYVIYTSGSTGQPKGVMVEHRNVSALWRALEHIYEESPCRRVGVNASIAFDASVKQLVQLLSGRTVVLIPQELRLDPQGLIQYLKTCDVNCIDCTPSQLNAWASAGLLEDRDLPLRAVLVGGEPIDQRLWDDMRGSSGIEFYNVYGPTECTVDATMARVKRIGSQPTIGRPMGHARIYILDPTGRPVPVGADGEICIGGSGVSRGYLNKPAGTAERFVVDAFSGVSGARMYKTGDIARWHADGTIEYVGRSDSQVKVRGYRIELGEIAACIKKHPGVRNVSVVVREDESGNKRLVAYIVARDDAAPDVSSLRDHVKAALPEFMVPSAFVTLAEFPLTPSGKLNHQALPPPSVEIYTPGGHEPPKGQMEEKVAGIWCELLRIERVGRDEDFFDLGGNSIVVMQAIARLRSVLSMDVPVRAVFEGPSVRLLAARLIELKKARLRERLAARGGDTENLASVLGLFENAGEKGGRVYE
jgi:amino acid adenylation domain-containing protein